MTIRASTMGPLRIAAVSLWLLLTACLCTTGGSDTDMTPAAPAVADSRGTHFLTGFLDTNTSLNPVLVVIPQHPEVVNVSVRMPADPMFDPIHKTINNATVTYIELPVSVCMSRQGVGSKGVLVEATSDVVLYSLRSATGNGSGADAFLALPTSGLGLEYYVTSYHPTGNRRHIDEIGFVSAFDGTHVSVTLPLTLNDTVVCDVMRYEPGERFNVTLQRYRTLQLECDADLTGVHITASRPVVVLSGDVMTFDDVGGEVRKGSDVTEQLMPAVTWGRTFVTVPFAGTPHHSIFRVIARDNDTTVQVKQKLTKHNVTLSPTEHTDIHVTHDDYVNIETSKPVLVLQYVTTHISREPANTVVLLLPPIEMQRQNYIFGGTPGGATYNGAVQKVNLVVSDSERDGLLLDGEFIQNSPSQKLVHVEGLRSNYSALRLSVAIGRHHNLTHRSRGAHFSAMSYGYPVDIRLRTALAPSVEEVLEDSGSWRRTGSPVVAIRSHDLSGESVVRSTVTDVAPNTTTPRPTVSSASTSPPSRQPTTSFSPTPASTMITTIQLVTAKVLLVSGNKIQTINEALEPARSYSYKQHDGDGLSPTVIAVIVSLSIAVLAVVLCILGFLVAELTCRRREGAFRRTKVAPFPN